MTTDSPQYIWGFSQASLPPRSPHLSHLFSSFWIAAARWSFGPPSVSKAKTQAIKTQNTSHTPCAALPSSMIWKRDTQVQPLSSSLYNVPTFWTWTLCYIIIVSIALHSIQYRQTVNLDSTEVMADGICWLNFDPVTQGEHSMCLGSMDNKNCSFYWHT